MQTHGSFSMSISHTQTPAFSLYHLLQNQKRMAPFLRTDLDLCLTFQLPNCRERCYLLENHPLRLITQAGA